MSARERGILMSAPMVRAILAGAKTQTRRMAAPTARHVEQLRGDPRVWSFEGDVSRRLVTCPMGVVGDRMWVRETWRYRAIGEAGGGGIVYRATQNVDGLAEKWRPAIHMFRKDSRITLELTNIRVERLQDISEADALAEGCPRGDRLTTREDNGEQVVLRWKPLAWYRDLWEQINGKGSWDANPWVWVITFKRIE